MKSIWPAAARVLCVRPGACQRWPKVEGPIRRLVAHPARPYSISSTPFRREKANSINSFALHHSVFRSARKTSFELSQTTRHYHTQNIIIRFQDLPDTFIDGQGLPFRAYPLSQDEATAIFGQGMDATTANHIMSIMHGHRVGGTLNDPAFTPSPYSAQEARIEEIALSWLRESVPMDEEDAAARRAELELAAMEEEVLANSERLGLYKPNSGEDISTTENGKARSVYGESGLDAIRKEEERRLDELEQSQNDYELPQSEEMRHKTGTLMKGDSGSRVVLRAPGENPKLKYYLERARVLPDVVPEMSIFRRLFPSALVASVIIGASVLFASVYVPPSQGARLWPNLPPAATTILSLASVNCLVFALWRFPPAFRVLNKYFLSVPGYPRALAVLGNIFSHQAPAHLAINMIVLWLFGTKLHDDVGRANFLAIYFGSGVSSSFVSLASFTIRSSFITSSLGASGAIAGVIASYLWLRKDEPFKVLSFPPAPHPGVPGWVFLGAMVSADVYGLIRGLKRGSKYDHYAHLGGYAAGVIGTEIIKRRVMEQRRLERERRKNMTVVDRIKSWR